MDKNEIIKENLFKEIGGELITAENPSKTIKKWRNIFKVSQRELAEKMDVMPSVISDYESGRRKSPGIKMIKKIFTSLIKIDEERGGNVLREFSSLPSKPILSSALLDIKEFTTGVNLKEFCEKTKIKPLTRKDLLDRTIYGYSIIDSLKAIVKLPPDELVKLYGLTTERALIFTKVSSGRSPLVAMKVTNLKPSFIVLHDLNKVDEIAKRISKVEGIPIGISTNTKIDELIETLRKNFN